MNLYIVKRREFDRIVNRAFGGRVASYGPWRTLGPIQYQTFAAAQDRYDQERKRPGLFEVGIFYKGKRVDK